MKAKIIKNLDIELTTKSVLKEMGYPARVQKNLPEKKIQQVQLLIEKAQDLIQPQAVYRVFSCTVKGNKVILDGKIEFQSESLAKIFKNTKELVLFIVTIGQALEKEAETCAKRGEAVENWTLECIGSETVEQTANKIQEMIAVEKNWQGKVVRQSPGYNEGNPATPQDWFLKDQQTIFSILPAKKIGVSLTPALMMIPRKSVSAIAGIKKKAD